MLGVSIKIEDDMICTLTDFDKSACTVSNKNFKKKLIMLATLK